MLTLVDWVPRVISQGDTLARLAWRAGADADTVWGDARNTDLAKLRKNPQILLACDVLYLPTAPPPTLVSLTPGQVNNFVSDVPSLSILVMLPDFAGASYTALVDGGNALDPGSVGGDGTLSITVTMDSQVVNLTFTSPDGAVDLLVGHLDPIDTPTGQCQRLQNLGIPLPAPEDDEDGGALARAISLFQLAKGIDPSGECDAATQAALESDHGS
jgi:hypothetical protein